MFFKMYYNLIVLFGFSFIPSVFLISAKVPDITLNNGHKMPILGIGTCCDISGQTVNKMVKEAIDVGYRHIDTAYIYQNEVDVGLAIEEKIKEGKIKREDLFITTKIWNTYHSQTKASEGIKLALQRLNLNYIDLMLINWPMGYAEGGADVPKDKNKELMKSNVDYLETWMALEDAVADGSVKSIGVSNFNSEQITRLVQNARIKPAVNQIESHPYLTQIPLIDLCKSYGIAVTAYSPLAKGALIDDEMLIDIGDDYEKSAAQVMIRYQIQRGISTIPRSTRKHKLEENFNVFDFTLTSDQMTVIDEMDLNLRYTTESLAKSHKYYPFNIPFLRNH